MFLLLVQALVGNEEGWVRYRGPQVGRRCVAEFSQGPLGTGATCSGSGSGYGWRR